MKFLPSRVIWGGTLMTVLAAAEKDEKCSDYTAAAAAAAGGELLMRGRRLLRSKRPNCLRLIKTSGDTFSVPNICFLHFLWWRPSHICRTFMTKFFIGFCICLCDTLSVWHTLWSVLIIHTVFCLFCLRSHLCLHCSCSVLWVHFTSASAQFKFYLFAQHTVQPNVQQTDLSESVFCWVYLRGGVNIKQC